MRRNSYKYKLLVEGRDDQYVMQNLLVRHKISSVYDQQKVYLATWLAWQKRPGIPLGAAINQRYLDAKAPQAHKLIDWIRTLFAAGGMGIK